MTYLLAASTAVIIWFLWLKHGRLDFWLKLEQGTVGCISVRQTSEEKSSFRDGQERGGKNISGQRWLHGMSNCVWGSGHPTMRDGNEPLMESEGWRISGDGEEGSFGGVKMEDEVEDWRGRQNNDTVT
jgi:hypothetical protein